MTSNTKQTDQQQVPGSQRPSPQFDQTGRGPRNGGLEAPYLEQHGSLSRGPRKRAPQAS